MAQLQLKQSQHTKKRKLALQPSILNLVEGDEIKLHKNRYFTSSYHLKDSWKAKKRNWGHSLHGMASRSGSFPPALCDYFIQNFSQEGDIVLDPFSGKGTTALQACLNKRKGIGVDIAPEAYTLTAAKTAKVKHEDAVRYLENIDIPRISNAVIEKVPAEVKIFYHDEVLEQILAFREATQDDKSHYAQYWSGVMMGILHGSSDLSLSVPCSHSFSMAPNYVANYSRKHGLEKPIRNIQECLILRSAKLLSDGHNETNGEAVYGSAMSLPPRFEESVDLIVTSPPYFTAQTYAWDNWLREWFLGYDFKQVHKQTLHTAVEDKYRSGMREHLEQAYRVLKPGKWAFYVVGDVIKKTKAGPYKIVTAEIIAQEAEEIGFSVELIINDDIPSTSRYNSAFLKENQGLKLDRIVCLYKNSREMI